MWLIFCINDMFVCAVLCVLIIFLFCFRWLLLPSGLFAGCCCHLAKNCDDYRCFWKCLQLHIIGRELVGRKYCTLKPFWHFQNPNYSTTSWPIPLYIPGNQENTCAYNESLRSIAQLFNVGSCGHWLGWRLVLLTLMVCTAKPELASETGNYKLDRVMIAECDHPLHTLEHIFLSKILHMQVNHNLQEILHYYHQSASKTLQSVRRKAF